MIFNNVRKIQITKETAGLVRGTKLVALIQNGKVTQDPLKMRHFQRMLWSYDLFRKDFACNLKPTLYNADR